MASSFEKHMDMKTGLIETDVTFDIEKLQNEYRKILEEFEPFKREMTAKHTKIDNFGGFCLRGIDKDNLGELSYTKFYKEKYNKDITEIDFSSNTMLYRGYFKEILDELESKLDNLYRIRIIATDSGLDYHTDGDYFRYHIPIHRSKNFHLNLDVNGKIEKYHFENGGLYYFFGEQRHSTVNPDRENRVHLVFSSYNALPPS